MLIANQIFDEERALYALSDAEVQDCVFDGPADGESALKETHDILVERSRFCLRYPFWHTTRTKVLGCTLTEGCRAAFWYDRELLLSGCTHEGVKALRECDETEIQNCSIRSAEFGWRCRGLRVVNSSLESEYPFFECRDLEVEGLRMKGKYSFQYVENGVLRGCELNTKDAFWHSKNVTVTDCEISGEYLGWYSENLHLIRCRISGTQPLCYCKGLVLEDCTMEGCDLSFENSEVEATVRGHIDSVKNPISGCIRADSIGEVILDAPRDPVTRCSIFGA